MWIHQTLPTGHILHRRNKLESPFCPACGTLEPPSHFVTCSHTSRTPYKLKLISSLRRHLQRLQADPILADIALEGINSALTTHSFPTTRYPAQYQVLITTQTGIGWLNFLRGFVSTEWTRLHHVYLRNKSLPSNTADTLTCLSPTLVHLHKLWKYRNQQRHSQTTSTHQSELLRQTHQQITTLYQYRSSVLPSDRRIFYPSLSTHLKESLTHLQAWLLNHSHYILHSAKLANTSNISHTRPLTHYFVTSA